MDIGCGMNAVRLSLDAKDLPDDLRLLRAAIESAVPVGFESHAQPVLRSGELKHLARGIERIFARHPDLKKLQKNADRIWALQLGTLGGGNHFIELQRSEEAGTLFVQVHTGSRGFGHGLATNYFELAREEHPSQRDIDLGFFTPESAHYDDYLDAVAAGGNFAIVNRLV